MGSNSRRWPAGCIDPGMMRETGSPVSQNERHAARQAAAYRGWEKRREHDEAVTVNLPADMLPLWEKAKGQFKGSPDERREAFLQFAHDQGDGAVIEALIDASDARLAGMLREYRARFAGEAGDADVGAGADAGADAGAGISYEAGFAGWLDEVGIGAGAGAGEAVGAGAGAGEAVGAGAGAGEAVGADASAGEAVGADASDADE